MTTRPSWQLTTPMDAIIFDCDSTLSRIEGINELALINGVGPEVLRLTRIAMDEIGVTADLYRQRINLVKPSHQQLLDLGQRYFFDRSDDVLAVLEIYKQLSKSLYIVSAGLNPAVKIFGEMLGIPEQHIFAVDATFNEDGSFKSYDENCPLTDSGGKPKLVQQIAQVRGRVMHVGDGMNDFEAHDFVDRFIGFGGSGYREKVAEACQFYIKSASLAPLLPLSLTEEEVARLDSQAQTIYAEGMSYIDDDGVIIRTE